MANTYTQIHIHCIFAVQFRKCLINPIWEEELYKYITTIVQNNGHKLLAINGMPDHLHILLGLRPAQSLSDLIKEVKQNSTKWINRKGLVPGKFSWQGGFGAFSYRKRDVPSIKKYIHNQKSHHGAKNLNEEYIALLQEFDVDYNEKYLFQPLK